MLKKILLLGIALSSMNTMLAETPYFSEVPQAASALALPGKEMVDQFSIIPYPKELNITKDGNLPLKQLKAICCNDKAMAQHLKDFAKQLKKTSKISLKVITDDVPTENAILMMEDTTLPLEGYLLEVNDNGVVIKAANTAGFFYALQTLKQLLPHQFFAQETAKDANWSLPFVKIVDEPKFGHRGFMLDVARHFFDKEEVMRILDVMALYKMNIFHWHLTDDQGWRIEIPEYPKLTEIGAIRKGSFTNPGEPSEKQKFFDDTEYGRGMWYSQKDLKEVVAYAKARNIDIIPEVDFPGHMVAAVTAYPELSCDPSKQYEVRLDAGISKDVLNIGNDKVIDFLECIMDNLAKIFPYKYIHFGGDECPTDQWKNNADCKRRVKEKRLKGVHQLQSWLVEELGTYVKEAHDKDIMVWDELMEHWNTKNKIQPIVMAWRGLDKNKKAADKGLQSITCPHQELYLDMMQIQPDKALLDEPYYGGWNDNKLVTVKQAYNINPVVSLKGREDFCLGVQANMWTETTNDVEELEYQLFPRLLAVAETGWLPAADKNWNSFYQRLQSHDEILEALGINYAQHFIEPAAMSDHEKVLADAEQILAESVRGGVGYPETETYDALKKALKKANKRSAETSDFHILNQALDAFKAAPAVQPQPGKKYRIISASTYYKKQFAGSTLYEKGDRIRFHYTPQYNAEELWEFVPTEGGYLLQSVNSKKQVTLTKMKQAATLGAAGTTLRIDKATIPSGNHIYVPGAVTISAVEGYSDQMNGKVKRLAAQLNGEVHVADDAALCYPGTWKIIEVKK